MSLVTHPIPHLLVAGTFSPAALIGTLLLYALALLVLLVAVLCVLTVLRAFFSGLGGRLTGTQRPSRR